MYTTTFLSILLTSLPLRNFSAGMPELLHQQNNNQHNNDVTSMILEPIRSSLPPAANVGMNLGSLHIPPNLSISTEFDPCRVEKRRQETLNQYSTNSYKKGKHT